MPTQNFKVGEMLNKRTPNSKTWINFDGSYTTEIYTGPVHFEDENGNLHNINTDLFDEADLDLIDEPVAKEGRERFREARERAREEKKKNKLNRDLYDYQGLQVPFDCKIPRNFRRGYSIGKGQNKLKFKPVQASPSKGFVDENQRNKIIYQDAWNDTDVTLEVLPNGIKETIILKTDRAPVSFSFEVDGPLADDLTAGNLKLQPAWLQAANGEKRDVTQTIRREGDQTFVDLVADVTGLIYPIEIDPSVTIQPDGTIGKDTYVNSLSPNSNYGTYGSIFLGKSSSEDIIGLFQFDYSGIPTGSKVIDAKLGLCYLGNWGNGNMSGMTGTDVPFQVYKVLGPWDEGLVTYNSRPNIASQPYSTAYFKYAILDYYNLNVTGIVDEHLSATSQNYGFAVKIDASSGLYFGPQIYSSEHTDASVRPKLTVTYNMPPTAPTVTSPNGGETWNSLHTISWNAATDSSNESVLQTATGTSDRLVNFVGSGKKGQTFTVDRDAYIKKLEIYCRSAASQTFTMTLEGVGANGLPNGVVYTSKTLTIDTTSGYYGITLDTPLKFAIGTKLAVCLSINGGFNFVIGGDNSDSYSGGSAFEGTNLRGDDVNTKITFEEATPQNQLKYHIQLTTDNGANWKDIVPLTSAGVTSYTYDFTNEPETSTAKIRIRAYDGSAYGPWDESNGVFTIQHNKAPTVPTNLSPSGGTPKDRASVVRFSWQHNDSDGDPQAQFDLQWRLQGAQTWNTVSQVTTNQYWDAPANTFPKGIIEWQVRTYDQAGLSSPYSNIQTFFAGDKPANPAITDPAIGATIPVANPVVQWSSVGQTAYYVKLLDSNDNLLWEVQANSTNKAQTIQYNLANNTDYKIQVAIKNADGIWSDFVSVNIHVSYTPPAVPNVTTTKGEGIITVSIDNPTPSGTQPNVSYNDLYRRKQGETIWTLIATNIPGDASFVDYTPASGQVYDYYVRAWGDNGTYSDSLIVSESISFMGIWLHEAADPLTTLHQFKLVNPGRSDNWQPTAALVQFAGRRLPVAEYDETEQRSISVKLTMLKNSGDGEALERLIKSKNTLCYRDARGRKMFCHAFELPTDDEFYGNTVSLKFEEVSYSEEV